MKKFLLIALMSTVLSAGSVKANQLTVNNSSTSPGQYTTLQAAITAAKAGDTILVSGSGTDYAAAAPININKPVTLYGPGYNPIKDIATTATISWMDLQAGSSGTVIVGFNITYVVSDYVQINNIVIKRNNIGALSEGQGDNWLIQENIFGYGSIAGGIFGINGNNILIKNNVFQNNFYRTPTNTSGNINLIFSNNIVFDAVGNANPFTFYNAIVSNNIFYDSTGTDINYFGNSSNTSFSNNIVYNNPDANPLNIGVNGNTGTGNKFNTNPLFTSLTLAPDRYSEPDQLSLLSNLALQSSSPGHNAGTDGKDIGLYGGTGAQNPLTGTPPIPQVTTMNILNTTVAPGGTLNVAIKAKSNN